MVDVGVEALNIAAENEPVRLQPGSDLPCVGFGSPLFFTVLTGT